MKSKLKALSFFTFTFLFIHCQGDSRKVVNPPNISYGDIQGYVKESITHNPLSNVTVIIETLPQTIIETNSSGFYSVTDIVTGTYLLYGFREGYLVDSILIKVEAEEVSNCDLYLTKLQKNLSHTILWSIQQSPITIMDTFIVEEYDTLLIEAGVTVKFEVDVPLIIKGTLLSYGTPADSVVLTCLNHSWFWGGIDFLNNQFTSILEYTTVTHCSEKMLYILNSSPYLYKCNLDYSFTSWETGGWMIYCEGASHPVLVRCQMRRFSNHRAYGVYCLSPSNPTLIQNNILGTHARFDTCVVGGGFLSGNYLATYVQQGNECVLVPDMSLGSPVDEIGDGLCTTSSTDSLGLFINVDGNTRPRSIPN
jgi:hypothetical protein